MNPIYREIEYALKVVLKHVRLYSLQEFSEESEFHVCSSIITATSFMQLY
jgi:hypothetical protein